MKALIFMFVCILGAAMVRKYFEVKAWAKELAENALGTDDIIEGLKAQEKMLEDTPKSIAGATKIYLPQIEEDFPEFHWLEWKKRCENQLIAYLECLEADHVVGLDDCSDALVDRVEMEIEDRRQREVKEKFDEEKIHQTEITAYKKESGLVSIQMKTAIQYMHTLEGEESIENKKEQHRFLMELDYIQDMDKAGAYDTAAVAKCKNCGAPITNLGAKKCAYCGCAVEVLNIRVWKLSKIEVAD